MFRKILVAALLLGAAPFVSANDCSVELTGNDQLQFNLKTIEVSKACESFTINFKHIGKLAREVMGHNVVITKAADKNAVNSAGMQAGIANDYVPQNDARVIAASNLIGGGDTTSVSFDPKKVAEGDVFFCSFPGHAAIMTGELKLVE